VDHIRDRIVDQIEDHIMVDRIVDRIMDRKFTALFFKEKSYLLTLWVKNKLFSHKYVE
jgi:hypothetical protein